MNKHNLRRSHSAKCLTLPRTSSTYNNSLNNETSSSLPEAFISSLRQLFSILDKNDCGYVPLDIFKRYFDCSSLTFKFLHELEIRSKSNNNFITFNLLINVIEQLLLSTKRSSPTSMSKTSHSLNCPTSKLLISSKEKKIQQPIPIVYRSSKGLIMNNSNPICHTKNSNQTNEINYSMIRSIEQLNSERNLLIQTCGALDRVKLYLTNCLFEMKDKQKSYCHYLSKIETTELSSISMYNRDLIADLFKLSNVIIKEKSKDYSSSSSSSSYEMNSQYQKEIKVKDNYIQQLETEKRVLIEELMEMKRQNGTAIPIKIA